MSDTRPALTARWRELERQGWVFRIAQRRMEAVGKGELWDSAIVEAYHPWIRMQNYVCHVTIPLNEYTEIEMLRKYENAL